MSTPQISAAADAARESARQDNGQFGTQARAESTTTLAPASLTPMGVIVRRQEWINDHAVDIDNGETFDLAPVLAMMSEEERHEIIESLAYAGHAHNDIGDNLVHDAEALGLIEEHDGPFSLDVDTHELVAWREATEITPMVRQSVQQNLISIQSQKVAAELAEVRAKEARLAERSNRLELAERILGPDSNIQAGDTIDILRWDDEGNGNGSHDIGFAMVRNVHGEKVGNFGENGCGEEPIAAGWDGATDFDIFMGHKDGREFIEVDKVHAWVAAGAR